MSVIATAVRHLMAAGVTGEALLSAIAEMEEQIRSEPKHEGPPSPDPYRQRRNLSDKGWYSLVGAVIERDGFVCAYCEKDLSGKGRYAVDHVVPLGRGGTNDLENLAMACVGCNSSKRDRLLHTEWTPPKDRGQA